MYVCPEAVVIADYEEFVFYPCNCDVFYSVKHIQLKKSVTEPLSIKEEYSIHSCGFEIDQSIDCHFQSMATYGSCVCLYNSNTSFVLIKDYLVLYTQIMGKSIKRMEGYIGMLIQLFTYWIPMVIGWMEKNIRTTFNILNSFV